MEATLVSTSCRHNLRTDGANSAVSTCCRMSKKVHTISRPHACSTCRLLKSAHYAGSLFCRPKRHCIRCKNHIQTVQAAGYACLSPTHLSFTSGTAQQGLAAPMPWSGLLSMSVMQPASCIVCTPDIWLLQKSMATSKQGCLTPACSQSARRRLPHQLHLLQ